MSSFSCPCYLSNCRSILSARWHHQFSPWLVHYIDGTGLFRTFHRYLLDPVSRSWSELLQHKQTDHNISVRGNDASIMQRIKICLIPDVSCLLHEEGTELIWQTFSRSKMWQITICITGHPVHCQFWYLAHSSSVSLKSAEDLTGNRTYPYLRWTIQPSDRKQIRPCCYSDKDHTACVCDIVCGNSYAIHKIMQRF